MKCQCLYALKARTRPFAREIKRLDKCDTLINADVIDVLRRAVDKITERKCGFASRNYFFFRKPDFRPRKSLNGKGLTCPTQRLGQRGTLEGKKCSLRRQN